MDNYQQRGRARWPNWSHSSLDRQSNDRLGRIQRQRFEHWRQILRARWRVTNTYSNCHSHAYANPHGYSYTNTYSYSYSNCHSHAYTNSHSYPHSDSHTYTYSDAYAYANPVHWEMFTDAEAVSDFSWAAYSASSPHTTADAYRLAAAHSGASTIASKQ